MTAYHADLRSLRWFPNLPVSRGNLWWLRRLITAIITMKPLASVQITEHEAEGAKVRVYRPSQVKAPAALLWIHGGGLVMGTPRQDDGKLTRHAEELGIVIVSAYYGLAPEKPFPHGLNDLHAAWHWLLKQADELGVDPARIAIGGASAGGGLCAALVQRIHDEGGQPPKAQLLVYPMLDDRTALRTDIKSTEHPVWTNKANRVGWSSYLGDAFGAETTPEYAVPGRRLDLSGLPPAWIGVGTPDLFHDEDVEYARRLEAAGVSVDLDVLDGCIHAFDGLAPDADISKHFVGQKNAFLRKALELPA
ncbi:MAG: alpha/beta hydrolase [Myxococcota bacterium]